MATRRRGESFHEEINGAYENDNAIHFMTPSYYHNDAGPEPLDLSKLKLDLDPDGDEEEEEEEEEEERMYSRGRSRSRSVNEYDDNAAQYMPQSEDGVESEPSNSAESVMMRNAQNHAHQQQQQQQQAANGAVNGKGERTGPLQHREVVALQKVPLHCIFIQPLFPILLILFSLLSCLFFS
jgi:hypothetical protein